MTSHGPWTLTVVRARGLGHLRAEKSWRAIVSVTVGDHQCHELNLGCDGQNPNLKQCFEFHDVHTSSWIDICIYHQAPSKKKHKRRNLVASARCTLQELARLQAQQECEHKKGKGIEIKLNSVSRQKSGVNKSKPSTVHLIAKLDLPGLSSAQTTCIQDVDVMSEIFSEEQEYPHSPTSESSEIREPDFVWPETHNPEPKVHSYWPDSDDTGSEDERHPLLGHKDDHVPVLAAQLSDSEDNNDPRHASRRFWFAASLLPTYTDTISIESRTSTIDSIVDSFSPYRTLREARVDSEYERVLTELCAEWRFVGGTLVALSGLEAGVFGFSSAAIFSIHHFARRAVAVGSIASAFGLTIDAWFLLVYCNATPTKFQKMALDVYGKYLFFCISARIPAFCMFISACALMTFLLSMAWSAWPTAVLVMSFVAGVLVSLQFIVYGVHCIVAVGVRAVRGVQKSIVRCLAWMRPPPSQSQSDVQDKNLDTQQN